MGERLSVIEVGFYMGQMRFLSPKPVVSKHLTLPYLTLPYLTLPYLTFIGGRRRFGMGGGQKHRGSGDGSPPAGSRGGAPVEDLGTKSLRS